MRWRPGHLNNRRRQSAEMAALWPVGVQTPAPRHMRKSTSPQNDTLNGPGRPRRMTPRLLRGPTGSVGARHGPWATTRRARRRNGGASGGQTRRRGVHRAPRDSDSHRANRAREKVRAVPMPSASGMSGRAASVAAWLRAVCEYAAAAAPHFGAENGERRRRLAGCGARGGRPTHLGLGVRAQADGSERRARGLAAPEHARARHARPRRPPERPSGAYSGGFGRV